MNPTHTSATAVDPRELRQVLSTFVTGVTVVTTVDAEGRRHGVTANSFNSVSLDPPLVLWSQALKAFSHPAFRDAQRFAVNILADDQIGLSNRFARAGEDKFAGTPVTDGLGGVPLIDGCAAYLECRRHASHEAGDHMIFIGHVDRIARSGRRPLAFGGGRYLIAQPHDFGRLSLDEVNANRKRLHAIRLATHVAVELAGRLDETIGVAVWGTHGPTMLHWEPSSRPVSLNLRPGAVLPVLGSATGRVFAAWMADAELAPLAQAEIELAGGDGSKALTTLQDLRETVRRDGMAVLDQVSSFVDRSEVPVAALSVPVLDRQGAILLALTVLAESGCLDCGPDAAVPIALRACAEEIRRHLHAHDLD
jgi:flavin reductase (DIM6/NTAB) family NADH-FMN oxidoreductase RutF/DNA-binding IclR family transcriptional regulator